MNERIAGSAYLTVRRDPRRASKLQMVKVTAKPPKWTNDDELVVKFAVTLPAEAFRPMDIGLLAAGADDVTTGGEIEVQA